MNEWYNGQKAKSSISMPNHANFRVGAARLRQVRLKTGTTPDITPGSQII